MSHESERHASFIAFWEPAEGGRAALPRTATLRPPAELLSDLASEAQRYVAAEEWGAGEAVFTAADLAALLASYSDAALGRLLAGDRAGAAEALRKTAFPWHAYVFEPAGLTPAEEAGFDALVRGVDCEARRHRWELNRPTEAQGALPLREQLEAARRERRDPALCFLRRRGEGIVRAPPSADDIAELGPGPADAAALLGPLAQWPAGRRLLSRAYAPHPCED